MSELKLPAASGGGSISIKGPSSSGSDVDLLDTSGNLTISGQATVAGLFGVGTTSPTVAYGISDSIHVHSAESSGTRGAGIHLTTNASGSTSSDGARIAQVDSDLTIDNRESGILNFLTAGTERMRITSGGNVGIGTTSPGQFKLRVEGGDSDEGLFVHTGSGSGTWLIRAEDNAANQRFIVKADGEVNIGNGDLVFGTAGKGICLGVTSNTDSNTLDDYETGSWTPDLGNFNSLSFNSRTGSYTKIGRIVYCACHMNIASSSGGGGHMLLTGLPFTGVNSNAAGAGVVGYSSGLTSDTYGEPTLLMGANQTQAYFYKGNGATFASQDMNMSSGSMYLNITYEVA